MATISKSNDSSKACRSVKANGALTDTSVKQASPRGSPVKLADGNGLYLLLSPNGSKLWRWKYRLDGKEKLMDIGAHATISLADAQVARDQARKQLVTNVDPML